MKYANGKIYDNRKEPLQYSKLVDKEGQTYTACYPSNYKIVGPLGCGAQQWATIVMDVHSSKSYVLKNSKWNKGKDLVSTSVAIDMCLKGFSDKMVSVPKIREASNSIYGSEYIIEELCAASAHMDALVLDSIHPKEHKEIARAVARLLIHTHYKVDMSMITQYLKADYGRLDKSDIARANNVPDSFWMINDDKKTSLLHNDLHEGNILYNGSTISVIDWGHAIIGQPSRDLLSIVSNYTDTKCGGKSGNSFVKHVIDAYRFYLDTMHR